jgi:thiosulfate reductase cytochrome b subunit
MKRLEPKHPRPIRWMHWINVPVLTLMIWSGLQIYWANDVYEVRVADITWFHFFPDGFYQTLGLEHGLAAGLAYHFTFMWLFALNGVA